MALVAAVSLTGVQTPSFHGHKNSTVKVAEAASTTGRVPMWAYMKSGSGRLTTYTTNTLKKSTGYIVPGDYCKILAFYSNGSVKVTYPVSRGYRTAYASMSGFMASTGFMTRTRTLGKKLTAYRRSTGGATIGTVYASDQVIVAGTANGRTQVQYPCSGGYKLGWVSGTYSANPSSNTQGSVSSVANGTYKLVSALNNGYVMDVNGASVQNGANVQLYADNGSNAQKFTFTRQSDGYYTISNVNSGKMLDCSGAGRTNGTNIQQYQSNFSSAQRWKVTSAGNGYYTLTCKCNGLLADVTGARTANGTNIQMYSANRSAAQKWKLVSTTASSKPGNSDIGRKIVNYELSQVGIGDFRGNNRVIYNDWFYKRPVSGPGYAWCMVFQSYCAEKMGILGTGIPRTESCRVAADWYRKNNRFKDSRYYGGNYTPKAGDLVFYYEKGSYCHVGMVTAPPVNGYLQTVEGNSRESNGNYSVVRFTRNAKRTIHNSYVRGYGLLY